MPKPCVCRATHSNNLCVRPSMIAAIVPAPVEKIHELREKHASAPNAKTRVSIEKRSILQLISTFAGDPYTAKPVNHDENQRIRRCMDTGHLDRERNRYRAGRATAILRRSIIRSYRTTAAPATPGRRDRSRQAPASGCPGTGPPRELDSSPVW